MSVDTEKERSEIGESQDKLFLRDFLRIRCWKPHISSPPPTPLQVCTKRLGQTTCPLGKRGQQNKTAQTPTGHSDGKQSISKAWKVRKHAKLSKAEKTEIHSLFHFSVSFSQYRAPPSLFCPFSQHQPVKADGRPRWAASCCRFRLSTVA